MSLFVERCYIFNFEETLIILQCDQEMMCFMLSMSVVVGQLSNHLSGVCFTGTDKHRDYYGGASLVENRAFVPAREGL